MSLKLFDFALCLFAYVCVFEWVCTLHHPIVLATSILHSVLPNCPSSKASYYNLEQILDQDRLIAVTMKAFWYLIYHIFDPTYIWSFKYLIVDSLNIWFLIFRFFWTRTNCSNNNDSSKSLYCMRGNSLWLLWTLVSTWPAWPVSEVAWGPPWTNLLLYFSTFETIDNRYGWI